MRLRERPELRFIPGPTYSPIRHIADHLARSAQARGDYRRAEHLFQRALKLVECVLGPSDIEVATVLNNLGVLYKELGRFDEAESVYQRAMALVLAA